LVHGNHGHSNDLMELDYFLKKVFQKNQRHIVTLRSVANQTNTHLGIIKGGELLAKE